jgi:hypothetical protein
VIYQLHKSKETSGSVRAVSGEWKDESWCQAEQTEENTEKIHHKKEVSQPEFTPDIQMVISTNEHPIVSFTATKDEALYVGIQLLGSAGLCR